MKPLFNDKNISRHPRGTFPCLSLMSTLSLDTIIKYYLFMFGNLVFNKNEISYKLKIKCTQIITIYWCSVFWSTDNWYVFDSVILSEIKYIVVIRLGNYEENILFNTRRSFLCLSVMRTLHSTRLCSLEYYLFMLINQIFKSCDKLIMKLL